MLHGGIFTFTDLDEKEHFEQYTVLPSSICLIMIVCSIVFLSTYNITMGPLTANETIEGGFFYSVFDSIRWYVHENENLSKAETSVTDLNVIVSQVNLSNLLPVAVLG